MQSNHTVNVPRPTGVEFGISLRRDRRRALDTLRAFEALGESCSVQFVMEDGSPVPPEQVTAQDLADVSSDLQYLSQSGLPTLDVLIDLLYAASSHNDRSRVGSALDRLLEYVDHWSKVSPERVAALFNGLDPAQLVRAVGQTFLAATRLDGHTSPERHAFFLRFIDDLRVRGTPESTILRLVRGLEM